jgi:hypothetical protein
MLRAAGISVNGGWVEGRPPPPEAPDDGHTTTGRFREGLDMAAAPHRLAAHVNARGYKSCLLPPEADAVKRKDVSRAVRRGGVMALTDRIYSGRGEADVAAQVRRTGAYRSQLRLQNDAAELMSRQNDLLHVHRGGDSLQTKQQTGNEAAECTADVRDPAASFNENGSAGCLPPLVAKSRAARQDALVALKAMKNENQSGGALLESGGLTKTGPRRVVWANLQAKMLQRDVGRTSVRNITVL